MQTNLKDSLDLRNRSLLIITSRTPRESAFLPVNSQVLKNFFYQSINEFSSEGLIAYIAINEYKKNPDFEKALFIYKNFINPKGPYNVNIEEATANAVAQKLNLVHRPGKLISNIQLHGHMRATARKPQLLVDSSIFNKAQEEIFTTMEDTWNRYYLKNATITSIKKIGSVETIEDVVLNQSAKASIQTMLQAVKASGLKMPSFIY